MPLALWLRLPDGARGQYRGGVRDHAGGVAAGAASWRCAPALLQLLAERSSWASDAALLPADGEGSLVAAQGFALSQ